MATSSQIEIQDLQNLILNLDKKLTEQYNALDKKMTEQYNALDKKLDIYIAKTDEKLTAIDKRLERLETSQKNQIWALIGILGSVLVGLTGKLLFLSK